MFKDCDEDLVPHNVIKESPRRWKTGMAEGCRITSESGKERLLAE
jgi:hypothetical protein